MNKVLLSSCLIFFLCPVLRPSGPDEVKEFKDKLKVWAEAEEKKQELTKLMKEFKQKDSSTKQKIAQLKVGAKDDTLLHLLVTYNVLDRAALTDFIKEKENAIDVNVKTTQGVTPLHMASAWGFKEAVEVLLENGAEIEAKDNLGWTPLHMAAEKGFKEVVEDLLKAKAKVDATSKNGVTPLHVASLKGFKEVVGVLIKNNANVNAKDNLGWTPLHAAASQGFEEVIEELVKNNADVKAQTNEGKTMKELLDLFEAKPNLQPPSETNITPEQALANLQKLADAPAALCLS